TQQNATDPPNGAGQNESSRPQEKYVRRENKSFTVPWSGTGSRARRRTNSAQRVFHFRPPSQIRFPRRRAVGLARSQATATLRGWSPLSCEHYWQTCGKGSR